MDATSNTLNWVQQTDKQNVFHLFRDRLANISNFSFVVLRQRQPISFITPTDTTTVGEILHVFADMGIKDDDIILRIDLNPQILTISGRLVTTDGYWQLRYALQLKVGVDDPMKFAQQYIQQQGDPVAQVMTAIETYIASSTIFYGTRPAGLVSQALRETPLGIKLLSIRNVDPDYPETVPSRKERPASSVIGRGPETLGSPIERITKKKVQGEISPSRSILVHALLEEDVSAFVRKNYTLRAGIIADHAVSSDTDTTTAFLVGTQQFIPIEIVLIAHEEVELHSLWHQTLQYDPLSNDFQSVEFAFQINKPGVCTMVINFYYEQRWLNTTHLTFQVMPLDASTSPEVEHA